MSGDSSQEGIFSSSMENVLSSSAVPEADASENTSAIPREQGAISSDEEKSLPAWLRAEMGEKVPGSADGPAAQSETAHLRAELARVRRENERYKQQLAYQQEHPATRQSRRGGCLTAWLVFQAIGLVLGAIGLCSVTASDPLLLVVNSISLLLVGISIYGLWHLAKWGFYVQLSAYFLSIGWALFSLCLATSSGSAARYGSTGWLIGSVIGLLIFYVLVQSRWEMFA